MFEKAIAKQTKQVLLKLTKVDLVKSRFYLAGGTALALQIGHRLSVDLGWFTPDFPKMESLIRELGEIKVIGQDKNSLDCVIDGVKVSFLEYKYKLLEDFSVYETAKLASVKDILAMKMSEVMSRGSKKDFVDIYECLDKHSLTKQIGYFRKKFKGVDYSTIHLKKSLIYFADADKEPMPRMIKNLDWEKVKTRLIEEVREIRNKRWG